MFIFVEPTGGIEPPRRFPNRRFPGLFAMFFVFRLLARLKTLALFFAAK